MNRTLSLAAVACALLACDSTKTKPDAPEATEPTAAATNGAAAAQSPEEKEAKPATKSEKNPNVIATSAGDAVITALEHGSVRISWSGKTIYVDPTTSALEAAGGEAPKGDLVLITHLHGDHLDPGAIAKVRAEGAPVVAPQAAIDKAGDDLPGPTLMKNGQREAFLDGAVEVEAVPMYNLVRKRDNGEFFHPKGMGNGYVVTMGGARFYFSGDTECTPEMKALESIDAAFVCMNLPYTMIPEEAAECVKAFEPKVLYPYHYRGQDPGKLVGLLGEDSPVEVRQLEWYPEKGE
jgi:L-ascorbate metabolism protein UlaG (beta-lactamase superfamily)